MNLSNPEGFGNPQGFVQTPLNLFIIKPEKQKINKLFHFSDKITCDGDLLHLPGSLTEFPEPGITGNAFHFIFRHLTAPAHQPYRFIADFDRTAACDHVGHGSEFGINAFLARIAPA